MNRTWNVRSNDGAMNGLEFARCTTAGGFDRRRRAAVNAIRRPGRLVGHSSSGAVITQAPAGLDNVTVLV